MLQLKVDGVVVPDLTTDRLDMFIAKSSDTAMGAAQQELVQIEHGYIENLTELSFQIWGESRNPAQVVMGRPHGEPGGSGTAYPPQRRRADSGCVEDGGLGLELQRRHNL